MGWAVSRSARRDILSLLVRLILMMWNVAWTRLQSRLTLKLLQFGELSSQQMGNPNSPSSMRMWGRV